jgi:mono/diheme cytochrome c family protein
VALGLLVWLAGCTPSPAGGPIAWLREETAGRRLPGTVVDASLPVLGGEDAAELDPGQSLAAGQTLFAVNCAPCHRLNGEGNLGRFPRLNRSPLVTGQVPTPLIETVLYGRREMPGFVSMLGDQEIAAVLSYIRQAWDNQAQPVSPDQVQTVREGRAE